MSRNLAENSKDQKKFALCCRTLVNGPIDRERQEDIYNDTLLLKDRLSEYFLPLGMCLYLDDNLGYAHLFSPPKSEEDLLPRVSGNRPMKYAPTVLCVIVRKAFDDHYAKVSGERLLLSREEILRQMTPYLSFLKDDVRKAKTVNGAIEKLEEYGLIKTVKKESDLFEVQKIVKSALGADWLGEIAKIQKELLAYAAVAEDAGEDVS